MKDQYKRDAELLNRIARRDCGAAAELFDLHSDEIFGFMARRTGAVAAEDLLQEVFARALRRASSWWNACNHPHDVTR